VYLENNNLIKNGKIKLTKMIRYITDIGYLSNNDIILAAYPKTGSTWLRFLFCNLISLFEMNGKIIDFDVLNEVMISFGPRILKTHKKYYWALFKNLKAILMVRDPRDTMISRYHFVRARKNNSFQGNLKEFIQNPKFGLGSFFKHYNSWSPHKNILVKYEDLKRNTIEEFSKALKELGIKANDDIIEEAVRRSDFQFVRFLEEKGGHTRREKNFKANFRFTRNGSVDQWKYIFGKEELKIYEKLKEKYDFKLY